MVVMLGAARQEVTHYRGKDELAKALQKRTSVVAMIDEDPLSVQPTYLKTLIVADSSNAVRLLRDVQRKHRVLVVCPRLEEWLVAAVKESGLSLQNFGFHAVDGHSLHGEINERIGSLQKLITALLEVRNRRIMRLHTLLNE
ncbi:MAG TPA: hypothetical protein VGF13_17445 [Verrucomicrobiae bacterium]